MSISTQVAMIGILTKKPLCFSQIKEAIHGFSYRRERKYKNEIALAKVLILNTEKKGKS
ncbi:hypothetical protein [Desulfitobacterium hafniense]|nr:hypothetical protein [Desulfitobacterium hafniense]